MDIVLDTSTLRNDFQLRSSGMAVNTDNLNKKQNTTSTNSV
jgi:hypothetical protein